MRRVSYYYNIGDIVESKNVKIKIVEKVRSRTGKYKTKSYRYICLQCDNEDIIRENNLLRGRTCNVCKGSKIKSGVNDIWSTSPELGKLLWNYDDGYKFRRCSNKRVSFRCPKCGEKIKNKVINNVYRRGLKCPSCSDSMSYPNKIMYNVLKYLNINFETEYSPKWAVASNHNNEKLNGKKKYDFYIPLLSTIIEMHGEQHYIEKGWGGDKTTNLKTQQENDKLKKEIALKNGIGNYFVIECMKSEFEYIKMNIVKSKLLHTLEVGVSDADWKRIEILCQETLTQIISDYWSKGMRDTSSISKKIGMSKGTVISYLKKGNRIGKCDYDPKNEIKIRNRKNGEKYQIPVVRLTLEGKYIDKYKSITEASKHLGLSASNISSVCRRKYGYKTTGGYMWMYENDYCLVDQVKPHQNPKERPVVQLTLKNEYVNQFTSINEAKESVKAHHIYSVCKGYRKTAGGYKWMYKEDYEKYISQTQQN